MIPEIGVFALILAFCFSLLLSVVPTIGLWRKQSLLIASAPYYVMGQCIFIGIAYVALTLCFLRDDFSVIYVLSNSSIALPWFYKACALWGGHEGSMLLWVTILSAWIFAVSRWSDVLSLGMRTRILVVLGLLSSGFILFLLATSNPFLRQFQVLAAEGRDLNPLLQDLGFLFHPPMLYMGYVGFAVPFAFAIAALWMGELEAVWAKWTRPWTIVSWCCLTIGITLGSWWAYRELGWGGYWFWDPVENASFMPWLAGTALLHSLAVSEKKQQFLAWTLLLAIACFSLSLVGTFLVRSGVLTSVHAFAVDPRRGFFILAFLWVVIGSALTLFLFRAKQLPHQQYPAAVSRESALLLNNVFLVSAMLTVLLGTLYPLLIDGLGLGKLSVGAPYFNAVFIPMMIPVCMMMGFGIHLKWQRDVFRRLLNELWPMIFFSFCMPCIGLWMLTGRVDYHALLGLVLGAWITFSTAQFLLIRIRQRASLFIGQGIYGMALAHIGVAVTAIGIAVSSGYGESQDIKMAPGEETHLSQYTVRFLGESALKGPNYHGVRATFAVCDGSSLHQIHPEKRIYDVGQMAMTDAAIDVSPFRDIYISLGEPLGKTAWSVRVYYKPFIRWIWAGGFLMLFGGILAMTDRRYYRRGAHS